MYPPQGYEDVDAVDIEDYEDSDVLAKIKNVDGTSSGLDADFLDGSSSEDFVHRLVTRNIKAQHTFDPDDVQAPFLLGEHAQGQLVVGLHADTVENVDGGPA